MITVTRYHDFSCGHRVVGHEGKCQFLHGHNYRVHFTCSANTETGLDDIGRVVDFSVIKSTLCQWLEDHWDHRFLVLEDDPLLGYAVRNEKHFDELEEKVYALFDASFVYVPFNPTAENMALYLLKHVGPKWLPKHIKLVFVKIEETRKCSAAVAL